MSDRGMMPVGSDIRVDVNPNGEPILVQDGCITHIGCDSVSSFVAEQVEEVCRLGHAISVLEDQHVDEMVDLPDRIMRHVCPDAQTCADVPAWLHLWRETGQLPDVVDGSASTEQEHQ
ncbi:MAG: hypothetical protein AAF235_07910 [Planctomycetota bacterium]